MATKKTFKSGVKKPKPTTARRGQAAAKKGKTSSRKKENAGKNRGLIIFGVIAAVVLGIALLGKIKQGPPTKFLAMNVLAVYQIQDAALGPLASPHGVAVDKAGSLYVTDMGNNRIVKFNAEGKVAASWGKKGAAAGEFIEPSGVAVDQQGNVLVADTWNGRIQKYSSQGEYFGEITSKSGNFYSPRNVVADGKGYIFVADTGNSCIKKFDADANMVKRWGEYGTGKLRFQETFGLAVDSENNIYVGDAGNRRIKVYTSDGKWLRELKIKGWQTGVGWPMMALDAAGNVFAADVQHNMVWIYNRQGKYLGSWGNKPGKEIFSSPLGIAVGPDNSVYVSNMNRGEVVRLAPLQK